MANFGNSSTPGAGYFFDDTGNSQYWSNIGGWPGGVVTDLFVYFAGDGASITAQLVIWNGSNGTIMWQSGNIGVGSGTHAIGGQAWQHVTVPSVFFAPGALNLGFWTSGNAVWTGEGSSVTNFQHSVSGGPATLSSGGTEGSGALGAYVVYTQTLAYVNTGTPASPIWTAGPVFVNTGTPASPIWTAAQPNVNTGTAGSPIWTPGG